MENKISVYGKCPFATTQRVLTGKWCIVILYQLSTGKKRFNQLQKLIPGITQSILMKQLRQLEADGLVIRTVYACVPPKVEYELSSLGDEFKTVLDSVENWGLSYINHLEKVTSENGTY